MSKDKLFYALLGTVRELESVLLSLNAEKMPHDGDEFHERLNAAKQALAAYEPDRALDALTAEQQRLGMYDEAEKQEPVAWMCTRKTEKGAPKFLEPFVSTNRHYVEVHKGHNWTPLYTSPQQEPDRLAKLPLPVQDACDIDYCSGSEMGYAEGWNDAIDAAKEAKP